MRLEKIRFSITRLKSLRKGYMCASSHSWKDKILDYEIEMCLRPSTTSEDRELEKIRFSITRLKSIDDPNSFQIRICLKR